MYLNGIEYAYEKPYPHGDIMYRPDFYLTDYDIYLEHFGVDEHNRAKWLTPFNEQKYVDEMLLKRETHKTHHTKLLETYSYYNRDNILLQKLQEMLEAEQVAFKPRDTKNIYEKVADNDQNFGKELIKLIESFINLSKSRRLKHNDLIRLFSDKRKIQNEFMYERQEMFLQFALPILEKYDNTSPHIRFLKEMPLIKILEARENSPFNSKSRIRFTLGRLAVKSKEKNVNSLVIFTTTNKTFHFFHTLNDFIFIEIPKFGIAVFYFYTKLFETQEEAHKEAMEVIDKVY